MLIVTLVVVLPLGAGGIYLLVKGKQESSEYAQIAKEKKILNMVLAQGKVTLSEVALELDERAIRWRTWCATWWAKSSSAAPSIGRMAFSIPGSFADEDRRQVP